MTNNKFSLLAVIPLLAIALLFFGPVGRVHAQEEGAEPATITVRKTYNVAGQPIAQKSYDRAPAAVRDSSTGAGRSNVKRHYIYTDHLGSANSLVDSANRGESRTRFMPFGQIQAGGSAIGNITERGFTGHHENRDIGLTYMNARYYVPGVGRFASADTIVPDPSNPQSFNRFSYVNNNPLLFNDPSGHCPAPTEGGNFICLALFIQPESVIAGPFEVHGDGRGFSSNSDPSQSRGYVLINLDDQSYQTYMNPSGYIFPEGDSVPHSPGMENLPLGLTGKTSTTYFPPSDSNVWDVSISTGEDGITRINISYDLVLSGPLEWSRTAPHINGSISFEVVSNQVAGFEYSRDGFPWAEAYLHSENGSVTTIFQDAANRGNPHDLFGIEPSPSIPARIVNDIQSRIFGPPQRSNRHQPGWLVPDMS